MFAKGIADIAEALPSNFGFKLTRGDVLEDSEEITCVSIIVEFRFCDVHKMHNLVVSCDECGEYGLTYGDGGDTVHAISSKSVLSDLYFRVALENLGDEYLD